MGWPYCGWNKSPRNDGEEADEYDFLQYNEAFAKKENPEPEEPEEIDY